MADKPAVVLFEGTVPNFLKDRDAIVLFEGTTPTFAMGRSAVVLFEGTVPQFTPLPNAGGKVFNSPFGDAFSEFK